MANGTSATGKIAYASLIAAVVIPRIQAKYHITLTTDDVAACMAALAVFAHGLQTVFGRVFDKYFPVQSPKDPLQEKQA